MSLLGLPGYVIIGNSLLMECREVMYTPMYFIHGFQWRKQRKRPTVPDNTAPIDTEETMPQPTEESATIILEYSENKAGQFTMF